MAASLAERIARTEDALAEAGADLYVTEHGRVIRHPAFPHVYDANLVRRPRLSAATLDRALDLFQARLIAVGARHLHLVFDRVEQSEELAPLLRARGFARDSLLVMTEVAPPERAPDPEVEVKEVPDRAGWDAFSFAVDCMHREEPWYAPSVSAEIIGLMRDRWRRGVLRLFVAERAGRVVGTVTLGLVAGAASLVSVGTLPEERGRGVGRTLVLAMVEAARRCGADLIYLITRADDSPKEMYGKLGFRPALTFDSWLRLPR